LGGGEGRGAVRGGKGIRGSVEHEKWGREETTIKWEPYKMRNRDVRNHGKCRTRKVGKGEVSNLGSWKKGGVKQRKWEQEKGVSWKMLGNGERRTWE